MMTHTYKWHNAENDLIARYTDDVFDYVFPLDPDNSSYQVFLQSGIVPEDYVAPYQSTEQKVNNLLADYGLTREELKAVIYEEESN